MFLKIHCPYARLASLMAVVLGVCAFPCAAAPSYETSYTPAQLTERTLFLQEGSSYVDEYKLNAGLGAFVDLSNGVVIGTESAPYTFSPPYAMNSIIALGGNDGYLNSGDYGDLRIDAMGEAVSIYSESSGYAHFTGFYVKTRSVDGNVTLNLNTTTRSNINMTMRGSGTSNYFNAILAESQIHSTWGGGTAVAVNLSNVDIKTVSERDSLTHGGAVLVETVGRYIATNFSATDSVNISTAGNDNHAVIINQYGDGAVNFSNAGVLNTDGTGAHGMTMWANGGGTLKTIVNTGTIETKGANSNAIHIRFGGGRTVITNSGTLKADNGYVIYANSIETSLTVNLEQGSRIIGDIYMGPQNGSGTNTRTLAIAGTSQFVDGAVDLGGSGGVLSLSIVDNFNYGYIRTSDGIDVTNASLAVVLDAGFFFDPDTDVYVEFDIIRGEVIGEFANAVDGGKYVKNGYEFDVTYLNGGLSGLRLSLGSRIPEPATAAFVLLGLAGLVGRRRLN